MSRVQCLECGIAVVVDPRGVCPEGHVIGGTGVRVTGVEATTDSGNGAAAEQESMLRELQALDDVHDRSPGSEAPTAPMPRTSAAAASHTPPRSQEQVDEGFAELSALEAALYALDGHEGAPPGGGREIDRPTALSPPAESAETHAASRDDLADLEDLFASHDIQTPEPTVSPTRIAPATSAAPSMPSAPDAAPDMPPIPAAPLEEPTNPDEGRAATHAGVDVTNFTAHGGKVGAGRGGRRRRFGR